MKIAEIIWTSGAAEDYLSMRGGEPLSDNFTHALNAALDLLKAFPSHGALVEHSIRQRRILLGKQRQYGLYYSVVGSRLIVSALVDLRNDPDRVVEILRSRGIQER